MMAAAASLALLAGAAFMFVAALGVARLPDLYTRMQAATKAATVGVVGIMCGVALAHGQPGATIRAAIIAAFFLLTSPVAAHAVARSAHTRGVPLAPGTSTDRGVAAFAGTRGSRAGDRRTATGAGERVRGAAPGPGGEEVQP